MRWEDQEINHSTPENKFPEVFFASLELQGHAAKFPRQYIRVDQKALDEMIDTGILSERTTGIRIDRLCLFFRAFCRVGPGGDHYPTLGVMHFWVDSASHYAIFRFSPLNDWLEIMNIEAPPPN